MIGYYSPPNHNEKKRADENLKILLNSINNKYQGETIIIAGDFNRNREQTNQLLSEFNLITSKPLIEDNWFTCETNRKVNQTQRTIKSELDYIASNKNLTQVERLEENTPI